MFHLAIITLTQADVILLLNGLKMTLIIAAWTVVFTLPFGILLGVMRSSAHWFVRWPAAAYIEVIRSMPLVLYLVLIFLSLPLDAETRGVLTLTTFTSAYIAEIVRGGLNSLDRNQIKAAYSLGMKTHQILFHIAIPQAITRMIPALINQFNVVIKDTSLVSIGLLELTQAGKILSERNATYSMQIILIIAAIYFVICYLLSIFGHHLENRYAERYARAV